MIIEKLKRQESGGETVNKEKKNKNKNEETNSKKEFLEDYTTWDKYTIGMHGTLGSSVGTPARIVLRVLQNHSIKH